MVRTQIYLSNKQRAALKTLAYAGDQNVSDIIRRAVDRLLADEFTGQDWKARLAAAVDGIHAAGPELSDDEIEATVLARRARKRAVTA